jgi:sarcosine oxidase, subunit beta
MSSATKKTADAIIIGAGIIGTSTALHMARSGRKVIVVDKLKGAGMGSTSYSSGICRMFYSVLDSVKFSWEGYQYFSEWENFIATKDSRGYARLRECGGLAFQSKATQSWIDTMLPLFKEVGVPHEVWDRNTLDNRFGHNSPFRMNFNTFSPPKRIDHPEFGTPVPNEEITGGLWVEKSGYVSDPNLSVLNLQLAAESTGNAKFIFGHTVTSIQRNDQHDGVVGITLADGTEITSPVVVNAAGPHSSHITKMAFNNGAEHLNDMTLTTRALRQEVAYVDAPPGMSGADHSRDGVTLPMMGDVDIGIYFRPEVGGKILMGTTEPDCDHPLEYVENPDTMNMSLTENHTNYMFRLGLRIPEVRMPGASDTQGIVACYDVTEDWTPIYDKSLLSGYYMAIGTSGNQFKNAGVAGALMNELIDKCECKDSDWDHDNDPLQFQLKFTGGTVNTGNFSRKRKFLNTTASVLG